MICMNEQRLIEEILNSKKDNYAFEDIMHLSTVMDRELHLPIEIQDIAGSITLAIRYWNRVDNEAGIPAKDRKPIKLIIDCCGGDLNEAFAIVDQIRLSKTPVHAVVLGRAYSGAFLVTIACHHRIATKHSSLLFHEGSGGFGGDAGKFQNFADFYKRQREQMKDLVLDLTNISEEKYNEIKNDDYWLTADEAKELGIIDEVI